MLRASPGGPVRSRPPGESCRSGLLHHGGGTNARQDVKRALAGCLGGLALLWMVVGSLFFHTPDGRLHGAWGVAFTLLLLAFTAAAIRRLLQEQARSQAFQGSQRERLQARIEREYLAQLVESSSDAIISRTTDGTIRSWNRAAEQLFGYSAQEAIGRSIEIIVPPDALAQHRARRSEPPAHRGRREVVRMAKGGARIRVEITTAPIRGPSGEILGVSVISRDVTAARAAEEALRTSEERLREAQRLSHIGSWEHDLRTQVLTWSDEIFRIFEIDEARLRPSYQAFLERVHPEDRAAVDDAYTGSVATRQRYAIDHRLLMADGRVKHVHEECTTEYDAEGRALRSVGTVQDITERKLAEQARARLAAIVESARDAIVARTLEGTITAWNAAAERLFGYSADDAIGRSMRIIQSNPPARIGANTERLKRGEMVPPFESLRPHRDGTLIPVLSTLSPMRDDSGNVTGVSVVIRDLREEKKAQAQLTLAAAVFEHAAEGIVITDAQNRIVSVNRAFTRITGLEAGDVIGRNPRIMSSGMHSPEFYGAMWDSINATGAWQGEVWDKRRSGELYCQSLSITSIADAGGKTQHYCAIFVDITARKNAELALVRLNAELEARVAERTRALENSNRLLRQANEELNAFSYSVSHDLRGPVRRVHAYSAIALEALQQSHNGARKALDRIRANAEQMAALIEDLLRLSQISTRKLDMKAVDLAAVVREIASRLSEQQPSRRVEILVDDDLVAHGDAGLVRILLENLIVNAWKFTSGVTGARISIGRTAAAEGSAYFVRDNGAGFDMAQAAKLFRPFSRLHDSAVYPGTGIGLTIVQRIAARHGGRVWADAAVGQGATFYFTLGEAAAAEPAG